LSPPDQTSREHKNHGSKGIRQAAIPVSIEML
jgi:hypothetical protein